MKININLTVEVDSEAWADTYGIAADEVRDDVKNWSANQLLGQAEGLIQGVMVNQEGPQAIDENMATSEFWKAEPSHTGESGE